MLGIIHNEMLLTFLVPLLQSPDLAEQEGNSVPSHPIASTCDRQKSQRAGCGKKQNKARKALNSMTETTHHAATIGEMFGMLVEQ